MAVISEIGVLGTVTSTVLAAAAFAVADVDLINVQLISLSGSL